MYTEQYFIQGFMLTFEEDLFGREGGSFLLLKIGEAPVLRGKHPVLNLQAFPGLINKSSLEAFHHVCQ